REPRQRGGRRLDRSRCRLERGARLVRQEPRGIERAVRGRGAHRRHDVAHLRRAPRLQHAHGPGV
ncbi:hypothetical protein LTR94_037730, partial [Friedmanniomyces endolithicus]